MDCLSTRGCSNLIEIIAKVPKSLLQPSSNPDEIDLSFAENWTIRHEVLDIIKGSIESHFQAQHLDWPKGLWGHPEVLDALAGLFNNYFDPYRPIEAQHVVIAPGAAACLDAILYNICDAGDGVLIPCPYWNGYDNFFRAHSGVVPVSVVLPGFEDSLSSALIAALERTLRSSTRPIKALVLSNPHNPLGRCYSRDVLEQCFKFCQQHQLHLISDEVFALSVYGPHDLPNLPPFVSALSVDPDLLGCDKTKIHVVWSTSKDLAASGIRLGCTVTHNTQLRNALALMGPANVSTISSISTKTLLAPENLTTLLRLSSERLAAAYASLVSFFESAGIVYYVCNSTTFVLAKLAPLAETWEDESNAVLQYRQAGVLLASGRSYHMDENHKGWMRICFAVDQARLATAIGRIGKVYGSLSNATTQGRQ
ncbi:hypothetical protein MMC27_006154 [Xylographa pallens]|nr:hypothetical protein [Xylographa pallens]